MSVHLFLLYVFVLWTCNIPTTLADGLSSLEAIFQHPSEGGLDHSMAKDAAVCAYGKLCFFFCEEIDSYQVSKLASHYEMSKLEKPINQLWMHAEYRSVALPFAIEM